MKPWHSIYRIHWRFIADHPINKEVTWSGANKWPIEKVCKILEQAGMIELKRDNQGSFTEYRELITLSQNNVITALQRSESTGRSGFKLPNPFSSNKTKKIL